MKSVSILTAVVFAISPIYAYAGGNPEQVEFPQGYEESFTQYDTANRMNQKQVAKFYANETAVNSYTKGENAAPGSVIVMEIYSPKTDADGKPIPGDDGVFEIDSLAAIAVMENNSWEDGFSQEDRTGDWGFAVYNTDGTPKDNDLNCVQCHTPLSGQDYLFTYQRLVDFVITD